MLEIIILLLMNFSKELGVKRIAAENNWNE